MIILITVLIIIAFIVYFNWYSPPKDERKQIIKEHL